MHRSSDTIGALAAALAKAQAELTNPVKSLLATIPAIFPRESEKTFRYAPLAAGLDLVRKCLSQQEIAVVQTTAVDKEAGLIQLTTVLAHSSGEWMASDWPVCPVSETSAPHRMGASLTYARRYALFALVGIAGEDDVDAPDLVPQLPDRSGEITVSDERQMGRRQVNHSTKPSILTADASAARRDELLGQIAAMDAATDLNAWTTAALPTKDTLVPADALLVEDTFAAKVAELAAANAPAALPDDFENQAAIPKVRRLRDKRHREFVATHPCIICGRQPSDAHHLRFAQPKAFGRKVSDEFTVPVCRTHHRELHRTTKELQWWRRFGIDPLPIANKLWTQSHPLPGVDPASNAGVGVSP